MQTNTNNIRVSMFPELVRADMKVTQNDIDTNEVIVRVFDQSDVEVNYSTITSALIIFTKPDYHVVQGNMEVRENDLYYKMGTNEIAVKGDVKAQIQLIGSSGERLTIGGFSFPVQADPVTPWTVQSTSEYGILRSLIVEAQAAINDVDALSLWENYNPTKPYIPLNKVVYNGSCYINFVACQGVLPTDASKWLKIASRGEDGADGTDGVDGADGADGINATIEVGNVSTGAPGTYATVNNVGTPSNAVFNFSIPKGDKGDPLTINASGVLTSKSLYDEELKGFSFLATDTGKIYFKNSNTSGDWSDPINFEGPAGVGVPQGGTVGQFLRKNSSVDYEASWSDLPTKTARFVVGASTAGWTAGDCDYLCDGTADDVEINAAIQALPETGGEIVILDGTYNITAKINVTKNNVSIRGNGNATILKRMFNSSVDEGVITLTSRSGCKIADLQVDGNKSSYTQFYNYGIYLSYSSNSIITGNTCNNNNNSGILLDYSSRNTITGNTCNNNNYGIYLSSPSNNTVIGNTCNYNDQHGISLSSSHNHTVTGNTCNNNNILGIGLRSSRNNTITGNNCNNNNSGILLDYSSRNTITGNTYIRGDGLSTDYTAGQHTIWLPGTDNNHNLISNNNCMGKAVTNEGGTGNTLVNNKFDAS